MTGTTDHVIFRPGEINDDLTARRGSAPAGGIARRDLERYYALLRAELGTVDLSEGEASLVCDANNGVFWESMTAHLLWAGVSDAIRLEELDTKWGVDGPALVEKLRALTPAQTLAIIDAGERFWTAVGGGDASPTGELLRRVGLVGE